MMLCHNHHNQTPPTTRHRKRDTTLYAHLNEGNPGELVVTLHWVPEVILQRPELPVQVVVYWNGTKHTQFSQDEHKDKVDTMLSRCSNHFSPWSRCVFIAHFSFFHPILFNLRALGEDQQMLTITVLLIKPFKSIIKLCFSI